MASPIILPQLSSDSVQHDDGSDHKSNTFNNLYSTYDRSILSDIDPDIHYLSNTNNIIKTEYYNETMFNNIYGKIHNFSIFHLNIRSVPLHFCELLSYLDTLDIEFSIIALSETAINSTHISYNIPNYNMELNYRQKKKGGGVSLYIHNTLHYKIRKDLELGGDVNSVFIEILQTSTQLKYNIICGCVYRPPFMSLSNFIDS